MKETRKPDQKLSESETLRILDEAAYGVLALNLKEPSTTYSVPVNFVRIGDAIYFHGSPVGAKAQAMAATPHASFCVIAKAQPVPSVFSTNIQSVIVFGKLEFVEGRETKKKVLQAFVNKHAPGHPKAQSEIEDGLDYVKVARLSMDCVSGKMSAEYVRKAALKESL